jgi:hypothetical protein
MTIYQYSSMVPVVLVQGRTGQVRTIDLKSGGTSIDVGDAVGAYKLYKVASEGATPVLVDTSDITSNAASVDVPADMGVGSRHFETWEVTPSDDTPRLYRRSVLVSTSDLLDPPVDVNAIAFTYSNLTAPAAIGSWGGAINEAWQDVLRMFMSRTKLAGSADLHSRDALAEPCYHKSLERIFGYGSTFGNDRFAELREHHRRLYELWWDTASVRYDVDSDGAADVLAHAPNTTAGTTAGWGQ